MYTALDIAKYVIDKCTKENKSISNLQLQKILYFIQGEFYNKTNHRLFNTTIEAWPYGPVIGIVNDNYKSYGGGKIYETYEDVNICGSHREMIDSVVNKYRIMNVWDMVDKSHEKDSPWEKTYKGKKVEIPEELIKSYFEGMNNE